MLNDMNCNGLSALLYAAKVKLLLALDKNQYLPNNLINQCSFA